MPIKNIRTSPHQVQLQNYSLYKVTGSDALTFVHKQTTNDILSLVDNQSCLTTRLSRSGSVHYFFYAARIQNNIFVLIQNSMAEEFVQDMNKFIIMEDVLIEKLSSPLVVILSPYYDHSKLENYFYLNFCGVHSLLSFDEIEFQFPIPELKQLETLRVLSGQPAWNNEVNAKTLINDSFLNQIAISYKKGCFLGQETVSKIENNRGGAYAPVLLKLSTTLEDNVTGSELILNGNVVGSVLGQVQFENSTFLQVKLLRDYRVDQRSYELTIKNHKVVGTVTYLPYFKNVLPKDLSHDVYLDGVQAFNQNDLSLAKDLIHQAITIYQKEPDYYESLGVILGREEKFEEAISLMDQLLVVNPDSIMAHTNKSLYLMRLGKIEEAENEKSLATVKSFSKFGEEAELKRQLEEKKKADERDLERRLSMFKQVLEIDKDDVIANFGMADICFKQNKIIDAIVHLNTVLEHNPNHSTSYLLLGKCFEQIADITNAKIQYEKGISVATKLGEMMPANEMQARLLKL